MSITLQKGRKGDAPKLMLSLILSFDLRSFECFEELPRRLMARRQSLDLLIEVRILAGQQEILKFRF